MSSAPATLPLLDVTADEPRRGLGVLSVARAEGRAPLPLLGVEVAARVADRIAEVTVTQRFHNPYGEHLEAVYVFPLAGGAAVSDFELQVGARVLRGVVRERGAARADYRRALAEGRRAALLEQERDDVFTLQVGNLPPGEEVTVRLTYAERLPFFEDGTTELRLPLVVAPRYVPGEPLGRDNWGRGTESDTDVVPDASRVTPPRLAPGFDPRVALRIGVELLRGGDGEGWRALACSQHAVLTETAAGGVTVTLAREDEPLDRDFVLRWSLSGERVRSTLLVHRGADGEASYGMLALVPPARQGAAPGLPRDVVFLLDRSGSMEGVKMVSAARACAALLRTLGPRDRFALQAFDDRVEWLRGEDEAESSDGGSLGARWLAAGEGALERADGWLRGIASRGGTRLDQALGAGLAALDERPAGEGRAPILVLLTDGQVTDEHRMLARVQRELGGGRLFTVGIDTAVNEAFLRRLAALGGGTATFVQPGAAVERALVELGREIGAPLVVELAIEDAGAGVERDSVTPARLPDLFAGRAVSVGLRLAGAKARGGGAGRNRLRLKGRLVDGQPFVEEVEPREVALPALAQLWARSRVRDLEDEYRLADAGARSRLERQIVDLAVRHRLLTRFTAFVVVDEQEVVNPGGARRTVVQPVAMPAGWEMGKAAAMAAGAAMPFAAAMPSAPPPATQPMRFRGAAAPPPHQPLEEAEPEGLFLDVDADDDEDRAAVPDEADGAARERVAAALAALERALEEAARELAAGRTPAAAPLAAAREALLVALAEWSRSDRVPALQRFLRADLTELLAALGRSPAVGLEAALARHRETFTAAKREADAVLTVVGGARWGLTV
jgi:Ca-activated chloride channel family protein